MRVIKLSVAQLVEARIAELERLIREGEALRDDMRRKILAQAEKRRALCRKMERQTEEISMLTRKRQAERDALHETQAKFERLEKRYADQEAFLKSVKQSARELGCWDSILEKVREHEGS